MVVAGNKEDLLASAELGPEDIEGFARDRGHGAVMTSAKTGRNVEGAFAVLTSRIAERNAGADASDPALPPSPRR